MTSVRHLTCTLTRCQSSTRLSRKVCFISLLFFEITQILPFSLSSTSCWFVSKTPCESLTSLSEFRLSYTSWRRSVFSEEWTVTQAFISCWLREEAFHLTFSSSFNQHYSTQQFLFKVTLLSTGGWMLSVNQRAETTVWVLSPQPVFVLRARAFLFGWPEQEHTFWSSLIEVNSGFFPLESGLPMTYSLKRKHFHWLEHVWILFKRTCYASLCFQLSVDEWPLS